MNRKKILIVEDNELNLRLFADLLEVKGFEVICARDSLTSLKLITENNPELILMDVQLQLHGDSGLDILKKIKQDDRLKNIPVIIITAYAMRDDKEKIMQSGCNEYLTKPISIDHFYNIIDKYVTEDN